MTDFGVDQTRTSWKPAAAFLLFSGLIVGSLGGCGMILDLEERTEVAAVEEGYKDPETGELTTEHCTEYCDAVMANCEGSLRAYNSRLSCISTCNVLPEGDPAERSGNNTQCRLRQANSAKGAPEDFCEAAGPGGEGGCGTNCESWCLMLEAACFSAFDGLKDCEQACTTIPDSGSFDLDLSYQNDDVQCRLIHLGAAVLDKTHCEHGAYVATAQCVSPETGPADCDLYCNRVMGNCTEELAQYDSRADCLGACGALPLGDVSDKTENTVGCRSYHSRSAAEEPAVHCYHGGPTGDGHCGASPEEGRTGNCDSYCTLYEAGCGSDFSLAFADVEACSLACASAFASNGAADDVFYDAPTATEEDSLQCRTYYAVKALGDAEDVAAACAKAAPAGVCD